MLVTVIFLQFIVYAFGHPTPTFEMSLYTAEGTPHTQPYQANVLSTLYFKFRDLSAGNYLAPGELFFLLRLQTTLFFEILLTKNSLRKKFNSSPWKIHSHSNRNYGPKIHLAHSSRGLLRHHPSILLFFL